MKELQTYLVPIDSKSVDDELERIINKLQIDCGDKHCVLLTRFTLIKFGELVKDNLEMMEKKAPTQLKKVMSEPDYFGVWFKMLLTRIFKKLCKEGAEGKCNCRVLN